MVKCREVYIEAPVVYIPYGSFIDGESHDFDFFCFAIKSDLMAEFEKAVQQDRLTCVHIPPNMALWRSVYDLHGLGKSFIPDLCDQDDEWGIVAIACIREQLPNIYNFLVVAKIINDIDEKVLLKKIEKNIQYFTPYLFVNYRIIRKLSFALLQYQHLEKYGKVLPSKKAVSGKYPQYKMLIYGDAEHPYDIMEGIRKINEIKKNTINTILLCKVSYNIEAKKLSDKANEVLMEMAKRHDWNAGHVEGVMVAEFWKSYKTSITFESSGAPVYATEECPEFLFEEVKEKGEQVCIEDDEEYFEDVCFDTHCWPYGI